MNSVKFKMVFIENDAPCIHKQCKLLELPRSTYYRQKNFVPKEDSVIVKEAKEKMLKLHEAEPCSGTRTHQYFLSILVVGLIG